jgi:hypothetical protein
MMTPEALQALEHDLILYSENWQGKRFTWAIKLICKIGEKVRNSRVSIAERMAHEE